MHTSHNHAYILTHVCTPKSLKAIVWIFMSPFILPCKEVGDKCKMQLVLTVSQTAKPFILRGAWGRSTVCIALTLGPLLGQRELISVAWRAHPGDYRLILPVVFFHSKCSVLRSRFLWGESNGLLMFPLGYLVERGHVAEAEVCVPEPINSLMMPISWRELGLYSPRA